MQYLVLMRLTNSARPTTPQEGIDFIEQFIFPTLELCRKLADEKTIAAGGPFSGAIALALIVNVDSAKQLDELVASLPVWPLMETEVIPLATFEGRRLMLQTRLEQLKKNTEAPVSPRTVL